MARNTRLLAALACAYAAAPPKRVTLAIANERSYKLQCSLGGAEKLSVIPARTGQLLETEVPTELVCGGVRAQIDGDGYVVARVGDDIAVGDANEFQLELSRAAHACDRDSDFFTPPSFQDCVFQHAFGGVEADPRAWRLFWQNEAYWRLCEVAAQSSPVRTFASEAVPGQVIEVLRETPFVAVARGFATRKQCQDIVDTTPAVSGLGRAHVGGTGETSFSSSRETLSTNLDINWAEPEAPVTAMAAVTVELASELLGERMSKEDWATFGAESMKIPYEAQEPINFLHYKVGFEYKPHTDGAGRKKGKRVATTLVYCEAAAEGGSTVFPGDTTSSSLKLSPGEGDLLFFEYKNGPQSTQHAACPVIEGNKTTLTMWHRLGVSADDPWYNYEQWGEFHNPHLRTVYTAPPFRERAGGGGGGGEL
jgi:hypothetical protein